VFIVKVLSMGKYEPLGQFLKKQKRDRIKMSFADIESLIGTKLPNSSKSHRAWWSNNPTNNVMTKEWLDAGFETENVELAAERLVFRKSKPAGPAKKNNNWKSIFGCMKGMITLPEDFDPERPFHGEFDWEEWEREKFGEPTERK
jgi:predicted KAP-like P-loop ATPase